MSRTSMDRLSLLVDLSTLLSREVDLDALLSTACERMAEALSAERGTLWLVDSEKGDLVTKVALLPEVDNLRLPLGQGIAGHVASSGKSALVNDVAADPRFDPAADRATGYTTRNVLAAPIRERPGGPLRGVVQVLNRFDGDFDEDDERYLAALATQLAAALSLTTLRGEKEQTGVVLRGPFNRIVGRSPAMASVYERIGRSADTDVTVLFSGETGTGKTLLARAVHVNSSRQRGPFVTVDCTTLPAALVESELFGHERGAFTGADRRVLGRVEVADGGTLFLDEVGDLPLASQSKLLRFLSSREYERVGATTTRKSDVRLICATHRNLSELVRNGGFREDLYYRLRVLTIDVPPLRRRGSDEVLSLLDHFLSMYAERHRRPIPPIPVSQRLELSAYDWPGNVRELEHWAESAVVLGQGAPVGEEKVPSASESPDGKPRTLAAVERAYVERIVSECDGNRTEAAKILGIGRNTVTRILSR